MEGVLSRPFPPRQPSGPTVRINGKIRAREVRVIGGDGKQVGILPLGEAINLARSEGVDLVEIAPNANPPVCRVVDFGKYRYEQAKKEKDSKKHQHANKVKEIQLSPSIDPHDFKVKLGHAIDFLCEEMKVKISLRFRGREMAHKEIGFDRVRNFISDLTPYAHADSEPKLIGRGITVMLSPLPRNKRARNPNQVDGEPEQPQQPPAREPAQNVPRPAVKPSHGPAQGGSAPAQPGFVNNPFGNIDLNSAQ